MSRLRADYIVGVRLMIYFVNNFHRPRGEVIEKMISNNPLNRPGELYEIASMVAYLASPEAGYITGQAINVDGGAIMH